MAESRCLAILLRRAVGGCELERTILVLLLDLGGADTKTSAEERLLTPLGDTEDRMERGAAAEVYE